MEHRPTKELERRMKAAGFEWSSTGGGFSAYVRQEHSYQIWILKQEDDVAPESLKDKTSVVIQSAEAEESHVLFLFDTVRDALKSVVPL